MTTPAAGGPTLSGSAHLFAEGSVAVPVVVTRTGDRMIVTGTGPGVPVTVVPDPDDAAVIRALGQEVRP